jgi:hypothetical protein
MAGMRVGLGGLRGCRVSSVGVAAAGLRRRVVAGVRVDRRRLRRHRMACVRVGVVRLRLGRHLMAGMRICRRLGGPRLVPRMRIGCGRTSMRGFWRESASPVAHLMTCVRRGGQPRLTGPMPGMRIGGGSAPCGMTRMWIDCRAGRALMRRVGIDVCPRPGSGIGHAVASMTVARRGRRASLRGFVAGV